MILIKDIAPFIVHEDAPVEAALRRITANKRRCVFVVSGDGRLLGSLTDGDFRRWLVDSEAASLSAPCSEVANSNCVRLQAAELHTIGAEVFRLGVDLIPTVDERGHIVGIAESRKRDFEFGSHRVAEGEPVLIIAEIGINHNGSLAEARRLVDAARGAGVDCVKFQLRDMATLYREGATGGAGEDLGVEYTKELLAESAFTTDETLQAMDYVASQGLIPLCTPWDLASAEVLDKHGVPGFKVASADLTNHPLLEWLGRTGRPLIVSTGMSTEAEIGEAVDILTASYSPFALLQCSSSYPAPFKDVNLRYMARLGALGGCHVGYSGHERGYHVAVASVALGARIIEKHITLNREARGNDHKVSLEPGEFAMMVQQVRDVEAALGSDAPRFVTQGEALNRLSLAKSLVAARDIGTNTVLIDDDIEVRSPGRGLQPNVRPRLLGKRLSRDMKAGDFFYPSDLQPSTFVPRDYSFDRPWGLPVRFHDWRDLLNKSNPDFLEFHLSYRDLDADLAVAIPDALDLGLVVHSPDLFEGDTVLDLASADPAIRAASIVGLQRVIDLTRQLTPKFSRAGQPLVVASLGGSTLTDRVSPELRPPMYERLVDAFNCLDRDGVEVIAQTLPPYPWYLGGQRHCNLFVDPEETARFSRESGIRLCLDIAHTKLACNHAKSSFSAAMEVLAPVSAHLHIVDAAGLDGEGLQIQDGEVDWEVLANQLNRLAPGVSFIPEIWQGHVDGGQGFWCALDRLETIMAVE